MTVVRTHEFYTKPILITPCNSAGNFLYIYTHSHSLLQALTLNFQFLTSSLLTLPITYISVHTSECSRVISTFPPGGFFRSLPLPGISDTIRLQSQYLQENKIRSRSFYSKENLLPLIMQVRSKSKKQKANSPSAQNLQV